MTNLIIGLDDRHVPEPGEVQRDSDDNGVVINLSNVVSVRVATTDSATAGQYL